MIDPNGASKRRARLHTRAVLLAASMALTAYLIGGALGWSFNPLRTRMQVWVDRRFNRSKYDAERVVAEFAGSLRERIDTDEVVEGWLGMVNSTMQPAAAAVWVRE